MEKQFHTKDGVETREATPEEMSEGEKQQEKLKKLIVYAEQQGWI